jgi:hypothetical protein
MMASFAAAQGTPAQVIRLGDWVEIGNEVFMNIIATTDIRYQTTHNYDYEDKIQDRVRSRDPLATVDHGGEGDFVWVENRLGVDMRYQKNLKMQVMFEHQSVMDGNLIDNVRGTTGPATQTYADGATLSTASQGENNSVNIERYWIDYTFPEPVGWLRMRVGADLWTTDQAGIVGDDDPRFAVFGTFGPKKEFEVEAAAVIQNESYRLGLQNDNDYIYYTFGLAYNMAPYKIALHGAYFRDRFTGAHGQTSVGQSNDSVVFMPSVTGTAGPVSFLVQGMFVVGSADGNNLTDCGAAAGFQRCDYDIFSWGATAMVHANLGVVTPFIGIIYGSGDDDPLDDKLEGYAPVAHREITLMTGTKYFDPYDTAASFGARDLPPPARSRNANFGGTEYRHSVGNPFSDRIGNTMHAGINSVYSNPGTLLGLAGIRISPIKGHQLDLTYIYTRFMDTRLIELALNPAGTTSVNETLSHEISAIYQWTLSPHFDIRLVGGVLLPGDGAKDVAQTVSCNPVGAPFSACEGEDVALKGEARFRARF